jgi:hypothetical protein
MIKKLLSSIFLIFIFCLGCKEEEAPELICGKSDPVADLPWLKTLTSELNASYFGVYYSIAKTTYKGQTVLVLRNCCPNCSTLIPVYSCSGEKLGVLSANSGINPAILDNAVIIWKGDFYACTN